MSWLSLPPNTLPRPRGLLVAALAVVLVAAGCSTKTSWRGPIVII